MGCFVCCVGFHSCMVLTYLGCWLHEWMLSLGSFHPTNTEIKTTSTIILKDQAPKILSIIFHADHLSQSTWSYVMAEGLEGGVFSCEVGLSSCPVWGWVAAICEHSLCTPAGASAPVPEAAQHTAAPPAGQSAALEDCSSLRSKLKRHYIDYVHVLLSLNWTNLYDWCLRLMCNCLRNQRLQSVLQFHTLQA